MSIPKRKKLLLIIFSVVGCLIFLEVGLRVSGSMYLLIQSQVNKAKLQKKNEVVILCVGESTTALGGEDSYPSQLKNILSSQYTYQKFEVINQGVPGKTSDFFADRMQQWIDQYHPDIVIVMLGINDYLSYVRFDEDGVFKSVYSKFQVYKLYQWISLSLKRKFQNKEKKSLGTFPKDKVNRYKISEEDQKMLILAGILENKKRYADAEEIYRHLIETDIEFTIKHRIKLRLIDVLDKQQKYLEIVKLFPIVPSFAWGNSWLDQLCAKKKNLVEIDEILKQIIQDHPSQYYLYDFLGACYFKAGDLQKAKENIAKATTLRTNSFNEVTRENYKKVVSVLIKNGIRGVFLQYPLRSIETLKMTLSMDFNIDHMIFIENKENFEQAIREDGYEALFKDRFAGDLGHCTRKGNYILAKNIAEELKKKKLIRK